MLTRPTTVPAGCAAFGGAVSSLLSSPSELIQIQQQRTGKTLGDTLRSVVQNHGPLVLYRGFAPMLVRESVYTAAYLGLMPVLRTNLEASDVMKGVPASATLLISGVSAGMIGSFFSHPSDTIKTCQQAFLDIDKYPQYRSVSSTIAAKGVKKLMDGFGSRCLRQVIATLLLNVTKDLVGPRIAEMRKG